jgi:hypothetical protein
MQPRLDDPKLYESAIELLASRRKHEHERDDGEPSAGFVAHHARETARRLAAEVGAGAYAFSPLTPRRAVLGGKERTLYRAGALDSIVHAALARVLQAQIEPGLGDEVHSYRSGRSQWSACRALCAYLHEHARARVDPRTRGVFVVRRDIERYGESIRVDAGSPLWPLLDAGLDAERAGYRGDLRAFVRAALRPPVRSATLAPLAVGIPTGLPTQPVVANLYLVALDSALAAWPGGFYARYGDDLLFAHPDRDAAEKAAQRIDEQLAQLGLALNASKSRALWLTRTGGPHPRAPTCDAAQRVPYLGFDVGFEGARLRADKRRALWLSLRARLDNTSRLLARADERTRADALCAAARAALDRRSALADRYAGWLDVEIVSLEDLKQLDHMLALAVAERVSSQRGVRAFRACPPARLYREHGLPSLVRAFTAARRARAQPT